MILWIMQACGFFGIVCLLMGIGLTVLGLLIGYFNSQTNLYQPTAAKLVYKPPCFFFIFLGLSLCGMFFGSIALSAALESLQSLVQPSLINTVTGSNNPIINFMMLLISGAFGLIMVFMCYSISELDLSKTTTFDKDRQKIIVRRQTIFGKKILDNPLQRIIDVRLEADSMDDDGSYSKKLVVVLDNGSIISLDSVSVNGNDSNKNKEAEQIKMFLGI